LRTLKLTIAYDGAAFAGWQSQPGKRSVQATLEAAIARVLGAEARVVGSGRTDAGVHALGQVAHVGGDTTMTAARFAAACNHHLPADVSLRRCEDAPPGFHARHDALARWYRYVIWNGAGRHPFWRTRALAWAAPLDAAAMAAGLAPLIGAHDFDAFHATGSDPRTTVCEIRSARVIRRGAIVLVDVVADHFLRHMVRMIVGTLLPVGDGRRSPDTVAPILAGRDSQRAGKVVAAGGLYLMKVWYPGGAG